MQGAELPVVPTINAFVYPIVQALRDLGGGGEVGEIRDRVVEIMELSREVVQYKAGRPGNHQTEVAYRQAWARTLLKGAGYVSNPRRGYWQLTEAGWQAKPQDLSQRIRNRSQTKTSGDEVTGDDSMSKDLLPPYQSMINPTLAALRELGGSARKADIVEIVARKMQLTDEQRELRYPSGGRIYEQVTDDVRRYLNFEELIDQPRPGHWQLTEKGWNTKEVDLDAIAGSYRRGRRRQDSAVNAVKSADAMQQAELRVVSLDEIIESAGSWKDELQQILYQLSPAALEQFFARIFSAEGVDQVEIVNASGDGEISGTMRSAGFLTFRVAFKFIRGNTLISAGEVDDFRRSVRASRADKGMLITTGGFTQEAIRDAERGHAPAVELINGEQLIDKLKELGLGVTARQVIVEQVEIDRTWFDTL